jgi:hypothetical protein
MASPGPTDTPDMTADSSLMVGRWVLVVLGVLAWLVLIPFAALAAEVVERRERGSGSVGPVARAPRRALQESEHGSPCRLRGREGPMKRGEPGATG